MITLPKTTLSEIYKSMISLNKSSHSKIKELVIQPLYQVIYHSINDYSKEELETFSFKRYREDVLIDTCFNNNNTLAFAALIQKGVYVDKLSTFSQWLLQHNPFQELEHYASIFRIERFHREEKKSKEYNLPIINSSLSTSDTYFSQISYLYLFLDNEEAKQQLIDDFYQDFGNEFKNHIFSSFFNRDNEFSPFVNSLFLKIKEDNIDINNFDNPDFRLNKFLRTQNRYSFEVRPNYTKVCFLLKKGFRFYTDKNTTNLDFIDTLMTCKLDYIQSFLPYLNGSIPPDMPEEEQDAILSVYKKTKTSQEANAIYLEEKLQQDLVEKNNILKKLKI